MKVMSTSVDASRVTEAPARVQARSDFETLYNEHFDFVWRSLRRLGVDASSVEDAAQDTFVVVHRRLQDLRPEASCKAFLFGIALRVAHDYRRRARRKGAESLDLEASISKDLGPFEQTAKVEAARLVERFLESLDEDKRAVFSLSDLEEMTAPEVSEALGVKLNTVYSRLRAARDLFIAYLGNSHG
jgi:RNA polymerase sigma-70 factor (ECF subfamily)